RTTTRASCRRSSSRSSRRWSSSTTTSWSRSPRRQSACARSCGPRSTASGPRARPDALAYAPPVFRDRGIAMRLLATLLCLALSACTVSGAEPPFAFEEATIAELQAKMQDGSLDSRTLVRAYLDRIAAIDDAGPTLGAVIELN